MDDAAQGSKRILITGGTSGLGYNLVLHFLNSGYEVFATGRDSSKLPVSNERLHFIRMDLSDLNDVGEKTREFLKIAHSPDIVINNAGILSPPEFKLTCNGIEYSFQVNFLSHLLIDEIIAENNSSIRPLIIVSVTSPVYKMFKPGFKLPDSEHYQPFKNYSESKAYLLLIGDHLQKKYRGKNIKFIGFNPGIFRSGIFRTQRRWFHKMYYAGAPFMRNPSGIARILADLLKDPEILNGAIYSRKMKFIKHYETDKGSIKNFMEICNKITEQFVS